MQCDALLQNRAYAGITQWGPTAWGKYHEMQGGDIVASTGNSKRREKRKKPMPDAISVDAAHQGIVPVALFNRVQAKLPKPRGYQPTQSRLSSVRADLLRSLRPAHVWLRGANDGQGPRIPLLQYTCSTYANHNGPTNGTCGRNPVDAALVLRWLTKKAPRGLSGAGAGRLGPGSQEATQSRAEGQPYAT